MFAAFDACTDLSTRMTSEDSLAILTNCFCGSGSPVDASPYFPADSFKSFTLTNASSLDLFVNFSDIAIGNVVAEVGFDVRCISNISTVRGGGSILWINWGDQAKS